MSGKYGGGGNSCTICAKTVYPAETIQFEKKPYHADCFKCSECSKKMEGPSKAAGYDNKIYCHQCFAKGGFAQKQKNVKWTKKEGDGSAIASRFGGGGNPCKICSKTVYPAETVTFDKMVFHPQCFTCTTCEKKLVPSDAAQFEGVCYCTKCFKEGGFQQKQIATTKKSSTTNAMASRFGGGGSKCKICEKTVYSAEAVSFDKVVYHAECFKCTDCSKKITPSGAAKFEGVVYCTKCFADGGYRQKQAATAGRGTHTTTTNAMASRFGGGGTKCVRCAKTVYPAETVSFEKNAFHSACFTCLECDAQLTPSNAEGKKRDDGGVDAYCKKCFQSKGLHRATLDTNTEA